MSLLYPPFPLTSEIVLRVIDECDQIPDAIPTYHTILGLLAFSKALEEQEFRSAQVQLDVLYLSEKLIPTLNIKDRHTLLDALFGEHSIVYDSAVSDELKSISNLAFEGLSTEVIRRFAADYIDLMADMLKLALQYLDILTIQNTLDLVAILTTTHCLHTTTNQQEKTLLVKAYSQCVKAAECGIHNQDYIDTFEGFLGELSKSSDKLSSLPHCEVIDLQPNTPQTDGKDTSPLSAPELKNVPLGSRVGIAALTPASSTEHIASQGKAKPEASALDSSRVPPHLLETPLKREPLGFAPYCSLSTSIYWK